MMYGVFNIALGVLTVDNRVREPSGIEASSSAPTKPPRLDQQLPSRPYSPYSSSPPCSTRRASRTMAVMMPFRSRSTNSRITRNAR